MGLHDLGLRRLLCCQNVAVAEVTGRIEKNALFNLWDLTTFMSKRPQGSWNLITYPYSMGKKTNASVIIHFEVRRMTHSLQVEGWFAFAPHLHSTILIQINVSAYNIFDGIGLTFTSSLKSRDRCSTKIAHRSVLVCHFLQNTHKYLKELFMVSYLLVLGCRPSKKVLSARFCGEKLGFSLLLTHNAELRDSINIPHSAGN